jgi:hypothetical protein
MANGQETRIETLRTVIARPARRNDWSSIRDFHQGQRSATAFKGRIHDRTPTRLPKHQKALAERGSSIHDRGAYGRQLWRQTVCVSINVAEKPQPAIRVEGFFKT